MRRRQIYAQRSNQMARPLPVASTAPEAADDRSPPPVADEFRFNPVIDLPIKRKRGRPPKVRVNG